MRTWCVLTVGLAGCNGVFGLDQTELREPLAIDAAPDGPGCSDGVFGAPTVLTTFDDLPAEFEASLRHDRLEIWFEVLTATRTETWVATRGADTVAFDPPQLAPFSASGTVDDTHPVLTGDGRRLLFLSERAGGNDLYEVVRTDIGAPWGTPRQLAGLDGKNLRTFDVSHDGLTLYFKDSNADTLTTYVARRATFDAPFGEATIAAHNTSSPSISPDELELFYNAPGTSRLEKRVRVDPALPFDDNAILIADSGDDPDLAGDGRTMVIARSNTLVLLERTCP